MTAAMGGATFAFPLAATNTGPTALTATDIARGVGYMLRNYPSAAAFVIAQISPAHDAPGEMRLYLTPGYLNVVKAAEFADWSNRRETVKDKIYVVLKRYFTAIKSSVADTVLKAEAEKLADLEYTIATNTIGDDDDNADSDIGPVEAAWDATTIRSAQEMDANDAYKNSISFTQLLATLGDSAAGSDLSK